jgi:hypothetical protein
MAGLLARGFSLIAAFPVAQWFVGFQLSAYSCGGSHGFGPFWVVRTVFRI